MVSKMKIHEILTKNLSPNQIDEVLSSNYASDNVSNQYLNCVNDLRQYFSNLQTLRTSQNPSSDVQETTESTNLKETAIRELVNYLFQLKHVKKQLILLRVISKLVQLKLIEAKYACDFILKNLNPNETNTYIWCKSFDYVKKLIPTLDYKSCRDVFKVLLENIKKISLISHATIPDVISMSYDHNSADKKTDDTRIETLYEIVDYVLDSNNYFLPRYLAINEVKTVLTFGKEAYNERFHKLFSKYIDSFLPLTHLLCVSGRDCLLPIIGFSNLVTVHSVWRFTSASCKFNTSVPLPFNKIKHISKQQFDIFTYILRQSTPLYLALQLVGLAPRAKTRVQGLEEVFVYAIIDTMKRTQSMNDEYEIHRIWNNLLNSLVNLSSNQNVSVAAILTELLTKLKIERFEATRSRDWLMWYLLQVFSTNPAKKQKISAEFMIIIDIYDLFYKDDEPLQNPDLNSYLSIVKYSALSIWIQFNKKPDNKPFITPEILQRQANRLEEIMETQGYQDRNNQAHNFTLAVCLNAYSSDNSAFSKPFGYLLTKIGKCTVIQTGNTAHSLHANCQTQPLSMVMIKSLSPNIKYQIIQFVTYSLSKQNQNQNQNVYIPSSLIDTYAKLFINDSDSLLKLFQPVWNGFLPNQSNSSLTNYPHAFYQNFNILLEILAFRINNMAFQYRLQFLLNINSLYLPNARNDAVNVLRYSQIYIKFVLKKAVINSQCALLKLIQGFTISDFYELLNSIIGSIKYTMQCLINAELEEINKAVVLLIARAIQLTSFDLHPKYEHKERDEILQAFLKQLLDTTPIYFPANVIDSFPKIFQTYFSTRTDLNVKDPSNPQNKNALKACVEEDLKRFKEMTYERQVQELFQNQNQFHTFLCVFFHILLEDPNLTSTNTYSNLLLSYLNSMDMRKLTPHIRTLCDFIVMEIRNEQTRLDPYLTTINKMINTLNLFTLDRFVFILISRSFDETDIKFAVRIIHLLLLKYRDCESKFKDFNNTWMNLCQDGEWNPSFQAKYLSIHPEKFNYDGLRTHLNYSPRDTYLLNYYGNTCLRCVPIFDLIIYRYIETDTMQRSFDFFFEPYSMLYKHHPNPILFTYTTLMYYNSKFEKVSDSLLKKRRILLLLNASFKPEVATFTDLFMSYLNALQVAITKLAQQTSQQVMQKLSLSTIKLTELTDIKDIIDDNYYLSLLERLVNKMLDKEDLRYPNFDIQKSEFDNPACHVLYMILIELISLPLFSEDSLKFSSNICKNIMNLFLSKKLTPLTYSTDFVEFEFNSEYLYWVNAAGLIIANLPESYWCSIYEYLLQAMIENQVLNTPSIDNLLDYFDLYIAAEKNLMSDIAILIALFHAILYHSNANHFQFFVKYLMETMINHVRTEAHFLFVCKLIGPFLSKIHIENTSLLIDLANCLYEMVYKIDISNETLIYIDTISNFFYYLKYRHIGESTKGKIQAIIPRLKPDLKKYFKYIISDFSAQLDKQISSN